MSVAMFAIILLTYLGLGSPTPNFNSTASPPAGGPVSSQGAISPQVEAIFQQHCAACHISQQLGGLSLANYAGLIKGGNVVPGPVVIPGDHKNSTLYKMIQPAGPWPGGNRMPLGGPYLSPSDINTIASWIDGLPKQGNVNSGAPGSSGNGANGSGGITGGTTSGSAPTTTPSTSGAAVPPAGGQQVSFKNDVQPIFQQHCAQCHIAIQSGGLSLSSYQGLIKGGTVVPGAIVKAGDPEGSTLYKMISPSGPWPGGSRMPLGGPYLDSAQIQTIETWIKQGAKNN
jgi:mono/diheme cytochrome c family protein